MSKFPEENPSASPGPPPIPPAGCQAVALASSDVSSKTELIPIPRYLLDRILLELQGGGTDWIDQVARRQVKVDIEAAMMHVMERRDP